MLASFLFMPPPEPELFWSWQRFLCLARSYIANSWLPFSPGGRRHQSAVARRFHYEQGLPSLRLADRRRPGEFPAHQAGYRESGEARRLKTRTCSSCWCLLGVRLHWQRQHGQAFLRLSGHDDDHAERACRISSRPPVARLARARQG